MKRTLWLICLLCTSVLAQPPATNQPAAPIPTPEAAPALTNASVTAPKTNTAATEKKRQKRAAKSGVPKRRDPASELKSTPLVAGPAVVIASNVNVRGQAGFKGEVVARLNKEQPVTVLEEITLKKSAPDEPSAWAKILLPTNSPVWVNSSLIESNNTVRPRRLNVRGGPGENYSILGTLKKGDAVVELSRKGDWTQIEAPPDAFGFVAAQYLKQEPAPAIAATTTNPAPELAQPAPTPTTVTEPAPVAPAPTENPAPPPTTPEAPAAVNATTNAPAPEPAAASTPAEEPPPKRIVQREGVVRGTVSIQAPTPFELINPDNKRAINYLYTTSPELDLRRYKGLRVIVTGEESLEERWPNTPVITIQRIQPIE